MTLRPRVVAGSATHAQCTAAEPILSPLSANAARKVLLAGGDYEVVLTEHPDDIHAAQRLRFEVFRSEPGYSDAIGDDVTGLDADDFDSFCEHLLVLHRPTGRVVGCARVLPPARAIAAGGWYCDTEFDLTELDPISAETVEMGRAVVDPEHRSGAVTGMLWTSVLGYLEDSGYRYLMGCVSVPLEGAHGRGADLRGIRDILRDRHQAPWQVYPHHKVIVDGADGEPLRLDDIDPPAKPLLPPLMRGYLRLGAQVCGEPAFDPVFDVGDFLTVIDRQRGDERYLARMKRALEAAAASNGENR
ncbi:MAG: GNAT family N-acyltransferase [Gordonia sp. (in: high G+C Gram-positive bacteria)]|uniref:GNAT family N-acetyltransferase n=1 Tax=Gordonia sp. (in: high G+C Gram-positive bacteria) TaxID=84139 RepID=UPI0039E29C1A